MVFRIHVHFEFPPQILKSLIDQRPGNQNCGTLSYHQQIITREDFMGLIDKLRGEFIDIIEWTEPSQNDVLAYRFPRYQNEIKMGARLVVREGQNAVFVNEGQLADVYKPGTYTLTTQNTPI